RSTRAPAPPHVRVAGALEATRTTLALVLRWPWLAPVYRRDPRTHYASQRVRALFTRCSRDRCREGPEHTQHLDVGAQAGQRVGHMRLEVASLQVQEEHVAPEALL